MFLCSKKPFEKILGTVLKASGPPLVGWCDHLSIGDGITQNHTVQLPTGSAALPLRFHVWGSPPTLALVKLVGRGEKTYLALHRLKSPVQHFGGRHGNSVWLFVCPQMWRDSGLHFADKRLDFDPAQVGNKIVSSNWAGSSSCSLHLGFCRAPSLKPLP